MGSGRRDQSALVVAEVRTGSTCFAYVWPKRGVAVLARAGMHGLNADHSNIEWVTEKLIEVKRARDAIHLAGAHLQHVSSATLVRALAVRWKSKSR